MQTAKTHVGVASQLTKTVMSSVDCTCSNPCRNSKFPYHRSNSNYCYDEKAYAESPDESSHNDWCCLELETTEDYCNPEWSKYDSGYGSWRPFLCGGPPCPYTNPFNWQKNTTNGITYKMKKNASMLTMPIAQIALGPVPCPSPPAVASALSTLNMESRGLNTESRRLSEVLPTCMPCACSWADTSIENYYSTQGAYYNCQSVREPWLNMSFLCRCFAHCQGLQSNRLCSVAPMAHVDPAFIPLCAHTA